MEIGKLPNELLESLVLNSIKNKRKDVITRGAVGEDCAVVDFGKYACVLSTDPITGAAKNIGKLAIHISANDIASNGAEPIGILLTILAPPDTKEEEIKEIMKDATDVANELNIEIIGGHTEITSAVNKVVINSTAIGKQLKEKVLDASKVKEGYKVILTKKIAIEGTSIIAHDLEERLKKDIDDELINEAKTLIEDISVVKEGMIAGEIGVDYMHDITEGGLFGAIHEASSAINKGIRIYKDKIKLEKSTEVICDKLNIDPYRLIASGSLIIITEDKNADLLLDKFKKESIEANIIGEVINSGVFMDQEKINPPESDELYKVVK
ncbi:MAG: AIR synthase family protein [Senegalia sp. (in: firmicutes)]|uniref:AIR synthase family protein n=1 Tax=Senegalia sp. (in: firmicutes) TaxID=1924098 RepID=UPI003F9A1EBF